MAMASTLLYFGLFALNQATPFVSKYSEKLGVQCKQLHVNGQMIPGYTRTTPPLFEVLCWEEGNSNCQGLLDEDFEYCRDVCCNPNKQAGLHKLLGIECRVLQNNGHTFQGFQRALLPGQNESCYDNRGFSNCETLAGLQRNFCMTNCCTDPFIETHGLSSKSPTPSGEGLAHRKPLNQTSQMKESEMRKELIHWKNVYHIFQVSTFILLVFLIAMAAYALWNWTRFNARKRIQHPTDKESIPMVTVLPSNC